MASKRLIAEIEPPSEAIRAFAGQARKIRVSAKNVGGGTWYKEFPGFRRSVRLGAQLHDAKHNMIDLNYARAFLPRDVEGDERVDIDIELPALENPGSYQLRFDMACEGIDWFDSGGSEAAWQELVVSSRE